MAFYSVVTLKDINGLKANVGFWTGSKVDGSAAILALGNASNAGIFRATISTPIPLQALTNNTAAAANVETVRTKAKVRMRGADAGSLASPFAYVTIGIPAPIGTLINGLEGDTQNADLQNLVGKVLSTSGVTMSVVQSVKYSRGK